MKKIIVVALILAIITISGWTYASGNTGVRFTQKSAVTCAYEDTLDFSEWRPGSGEYTGACVCVLLCLEVENNTDKFVFVLPCAPARPTDIGWGPVGPMFYFAPGETGRIEFYVTYKSIERQEYSLRYGWFEGDQFYISSTGILGI